MWRIIGENKRKSTAGAVLFRFIKNNSKSSHLVYRDSNSSDADHLAKHKAHNASPFQSAKRFERVRNIVERDSNSNVAHCSHKLENFTATSFQIA